MEDNYSRPGVRGKEVSVSIDGRTPGLQVVITRDLSGACYKEATSTYRNTIRDMYNY